MLEKPSQIMQYFLSDYNVFVSLWLFVAVALNDSKASSQTTIHENVTMPCPALQDVVRRDGTFNIIYWSHCTSRCDHIDTEWDWIGGMNNKGITKVERERVNITRDGALEIQEVNPSDSGQYMCTVKTINHSSPGVYKTTLLINDVTNQLDKRTAKPDTKDCDKATDYSDDSRNLVYILAGTTCVASVLLVIALLYIVCIKRDDLCFWNKGNSPARESVSGADVA